MFVNSKQPNNDSVLPQNSNDCGKLNAPRDNFSANVRSIKNKNKNRQYISGTELYPSTKNEVVAFESQLKKGKRPFVHFPPFARGDMNAYKYIGFLNEGARPLTAFEYQGSKELQEMPLNENISVIKEHIDSMGSKLKEGRDYILCSSSELQRLQNEVNIKKKNATSITIALFLFLL